MIYKLSILIEKIEERLRWGNGNKWSINEFEALREKILEETGHAISVTTLKRIWGKAKQGGVPSKSTLNILAQFAGFQNWNHFEHGLPTTAKPKRRNSPAKMIYFILATIAIVALVYVISQTKKDVKTDFLFDLYKTSECCPTNARFTYDFGQQFEEGYELNFDQQNRTPFPLTNAQDSISNVYYLPGYYQPAISGRGISKKKNLFVSTPGWVGLVNNASVNFPVYLTNEHLQKGTEIGFTSTYFDDIASNPEYANLWLSNISPTPEIDGSNFSFSCDIKMPTAFYNSPCKVVTISIQGTNESIDFGFCIPNCTGDLQFNFAGQSISGANSELSQFSFNMNEWKHIDVHVVDNKLTIESEEILYQGQLPDTLGLVGGVNYIFDGLGQIKNVQFRDAKKTVHLSGSDEL